MNRVALDQIFERRHSWLLLKRSQCAAVRALPVHSAAGQPPEILFHAAIAYLKATGASPAERLCLATATASVLPHCASFLDFGFQRHFSFVIHHHMVIMGEGQSWWLMMRSAPSRRDFERALVASVNAFSGVLLIALRWARTTHCRSW
jgi:hypothetical protein